MREPTAVYNMQRKTITDPLCRFIIYDIFHKFRDTVEGHPISIARHPLAFCGTRVESVCRGARIRHDGYLGIVIEMTSEADQGSEIRRVRRCETKTSASAVRLL